MGNRVISANHGGVRRTKREPGRLDFFLLHSRILNRVFDREEANRLRFELAGLYAEKADAKHSRRHSKERTSSYYLKSASLFEKLGEFVRAAGQYAKAAHWLGEYDDYSGAAVELLKAAECCERAGEFEKHLELRLLCATSYGFAQKFEEAARQYQLVAEKLEERREFEKAAAERVHAGDAFKFGACFVKAAAQYSLAGQDFEQAGKFAEAAKFYVSASDNYARLERFIEAVPELEKAAGAHEKLGEFASALHWYDIASEYCLAADSKKRGLEILQVLLRIAACKKALQTATPTQSDVAVAIN